MNKREALRIHAVLLEESKRIRPRDRKITKAEALKVISQDELDYVLKAQQVFNNLMFERRTRGGNYYCL